MYRNNNHYWKKTFNTTNVEVVIDDPLQIVDTYIANTSVFNDVLVFDKTAETFVGQYESPGVAAVNGNNGPILIQGLSLAPGLSTGPVDCIKLFNDFIKEFDKVRQYLLTNFANLPYIFRYWTQTMEEDDALWKLIACALEHSKGVQDGKIPKRQFGESALDYLRRVLKQQKDGTYSPPGTTPSMREYGIPYLPEIPYPSFDIDQFINDPTLLDNFEREVREKLKEVKEREGQPAPLKFEIPPECAGVYAEFIQDLIDILERLQSLFDMIKRMIDAYNALKNSPCWKQYNFERELERRQIGNFQTLTDFFRYLKKYLQKVLESGDPFDPWGTDIVDPMRTLPVSSLLLDELIEKRYLAGNPDRYKIASEQYQAWLNESPDTRSEYPPIKGRFRMFDGDNNFVDEDVYRLYISSMMHNALFPHTHYRGGPFEDKEYFNWNDFALHMAIFAGLPLASLMLSDEVDPIGGVI